MDNAKGAKRQRPQGSRVWTRIFRPDARAEINEELEFHIEQRTRDYIAAGMTAEAARAAARERLGELQSVTSECANLLMAERRSEARREWVKFSVLDFKLGLRMLARYPGLTLVGGLAIAFAIWVGASTFELINQIINPRLGLPAAERVVALRNRDLASRSVALTSAQDFTRWQEELESVTDIGAFHGFNRNLTIGDRTPEPLGGVATSASAFRVARVAPLLGSGLLAADEEPGAPGVMVIGYYVWQNRFAADPNVVGTTVRLGNDPFTIVGVMPEDFHFPMTESAWIPLRLKLEGTARAVPPIRVFGRLARGSSLEDAQAEIGASGQRAARELPDTHQHLRAEVVEFAKSRRTVEWSVTELAAIRSINVFVVMLLALVCANVALLVFARAAARESEIVVRSALGASRSRIIIQLFAEALILVGFGAALGLAGAGYGLRMVYRWAQSSILGQSEQLLSMDWQLAPSTAFYTAGLILLGALMVGVIPALKVTRGLQARLREATAGSGGLKFGGVWTAIIVTQVALTLAFPATGYFIHRLAGGEQSMLLTAADEEFLVVRLNYEATEPAQSRFRASYDEIERRLLAEPGVTAVTFGEHMPRMSHPQQPIQVEGAAADAPAYWIGGTTVGLEFFEAFDAKIIAGRAFNSGDLTSSERNVIVSQAFVNRVLGDRNAIGRRFRYISRESAEQGNPSEGAGPWQVIVGVVSDLEASTGGRIARIYAPAAPEQVRPLNFAVHVNSGEPLALLPRLREIAASVDQDVRVSAPAVLADVNYDESVVIGFFIRMVSLVSTVALVLSLAGIYAVMSFTVARRTREIGVRVALGAGRGRLVLAVFARPLRQLMFGIVAGSALVIVLSLIAFDQTLSLRGVALVAGYCVVMVAVCALACIVPTRRALRVDPMDSLRADA